MLRPFILLAFLAPGLAAAAGTTAAQKDLDAIQGVWKVAELTEKGEKLAAKDLTPVGVVISGDSLTLSDDGKFREQITLKLDPTQKLKAVDMVYTKGPNLGKTERGIYAIEGDLLRICVNEAKNGARPTAFVSTKSNDCSVAVLKRVKK